MLFSHPDCLSSLPMHVISFWFKWPRFRPAVLRDGGMIRWEMLLRPSGRLYLSPSEQTRVATHKSVSGSGRHFGSVAQRAAVSL